MAGEQLDQQRDHERLKQDYRELTPLELGALIYYMQKSPDTHVAGTGSDATPPRQWRGLPIEPADLPEIPKFADSDAMLKEAQRRQASGGAQMQYFQLTGRGKDDSYVRSSLRDLEDLMGVGANKLSYMWFADDNGNAQIFLLDSSKTKNQMGGVVTLDATTSAAGACVEFSSIPDRNLNRQERLPPNTPIGEAVKIQRQRAHDADLVGLGIDHSLSMAEVESITSARQADLARFGLDNERFNLRAKAISMGLPPYTPEDIINSTAQELQRQSEAVRLGLSRYASADDVKRARGEINNAIDENKNFADNLPAGTTREAALKIFQDRFKQADLVRSNIDPTLSKDEIARIRNEREHRLMALLSEQNTAETSKERAAINIKMEAVRIGLPEYTRAEDVAQAQESLSMQSLAVSMGLSKNATQAEIDAFQQRSRDHELADVPPNICKSKE